MGPKESIRKLSILIPVYNEIRTLERLLNSVLDAPLPCERELVIVDDCSADGSREYLKDFARQHDCVRLILHRRNSGKGAAIRTAIKHFTGDWAIIQDADLEYNPREYEKLLIPVQEGLADAVFGSRFLTGDYRRAMMFWHTMANKTLTTVSNIFNDLNLTDMETCYKLIRADILKNLVIRSKGFDLEPELTAKLSRWGARIYEVPISYRGRTYAEGKKIGAKDAVKAFTAMAKYRFFDTYYVRHDGFLILQALKRARKFNQWMFDQIRPFIGDEVLEAGSGIGNLTELLLNKRRLVCIDYEDFYVDRLRQNYGHMANFNIQQGDLTNPGDVQSAISNDPVDTVICLNVAEHIEDDMAVFRNFYNALKPGGRAIILVPHNPALYNKIDEVLGHFRRYSFDELSGKMQDAGFRVVSTKGFNRVGGLGWHMSSIMGRKTISPGQMTVFEAGLPLIKLAEHFPIHSHNSVICVGEKPS